jgi:hypothetical protein
MTFRFTKTACVVAIALLGTATLATAQSSSGTGGTSGTTTGTAPAASSTQPSGSSTATPGPGTRGPADTTSSGTVGQSGLRQPGRDVQLQDPKQDPVVRETEQEVSKRIKSICKGC